MPYRSQQEVNSAVQKCLANPDDQEAFECAVQVSEQTPQELCGPRFVMLTQKGCSVCDEERGIKKDLIESGMIEEIDIYSKRGRAIAELNDIDATPAVLLLDCNNRLIDYAEPETQRLIAGLDQS